MASNPIKFGRTAWTLAWEGFGRTSAGPTTRQSFNFRFPFQQQARLLSQYSVRRQCSGGLLLLGLDSSSPTTQTIVGSCNTAAECPATGNKSSAGTISRLARHAWIRNVHITSASSARIQRRLKSTKAGEEEGNAASAQPKSQQTYPATKKPEGTKNATKQENHDTLTDSVSKYLHLPHLPHRPTKEELLSAASGFWERLKVRFKWFSIRSTRPFNADEWGAFLSWILFGHFVWILVGTTTFFSLVILTVNTVVAQGMAHVTLLLRRMMMLMMKNRNPSSMGRRPSHSSCWSDGCLRIRDCAKMGRRRHHVPECLCVTTARPDQVLGLQRLTDRCRSGRSSCVYSGDSGQRG